MDRQINTLIPGPNNEISDAWVEIGGVRVTTVPIGEPFTIHCKYRAQNDISYLAAQIDYTKICVTVAGEGIKRYEDTTMMGSELTESFSLDKFRKTTPSPPKMPAGNVPLILTFRLWLHDDATIDPPYPPEAQW